MCVYTFLSNRLPFHQKEIVQEPEFCAVHWLMDIIHLNIDSWRMRVKSRMAYAERMLI